MRRLASASLDQNLFNNGPTQPINYQQYPEITNGGRLPPKTANYNQQQPKNNDDRGGHG
jgi:hypothetical protein